jgi:two-component system sensor histidine kinase CpxA
MKTLFAKILLWFVACAVLAVTGFFAVSALVESGARRGSEPHLRVLRFHGGEALHAYEEGGPAAVSALLDRMRAAYDFTPLLTGPEGRDLAGSGRDFGPLVERARRNRVFFDLARRALVLALPLDGRDGPYWFFLVLPREHFGFWPRMRRFLMLPHLWVLGSILLLSYILARHLTRPILELRAAAERLGSGDLTARVSTERRDELGDLARGFNRMADRVQHAVTAQQQLVQDVSHELRSPLSRLGVAIELARQDPAQLDRVAREAGRLNELVGELLALSRDRLRPETVDLAVLLGLLVDGARIEADRRPCRLLLDAQPGLVLTADPELLRRAVENVLRNAIRHTPPESEVRVAARLTGPSVEITVQDAGPGVPEGALPRLFDPFFRVETDRDRTTGGAGLGLAIARRAVELHGGTIQAANTHPGLRVTMVIPPADHSARVK